MSTYQQASQHSFRIYVIGVIMLYLAWFAACAHAAAPLAGTVIENQATNEYTDPDTGEKYLLNSNTVRIIVQPFESLLLTQDNSVISVPGAKVHTTHVLENTGNTTSTYILEYGITDTEGFLLTPLRLYKDVNMDGIANPGEVYLVSGSQVTLAPGEKLYLVFAATVPADVQFGDQSSFHLVATAVISGVSATNHDKVTIGSKVALQLTKNATNPSARPGDVVEYNIQGSNTGLLDASPVDIMLDGQTAQYVMCVDDVPANTAFVEAQGSGSGLLLYHRFGDPYNSYQSSVPSNPSSVDSVAYGLPHLKSGEGFTLTIRVRLNPAASGDIHNTATLTCKDPMSAMEIAAASNTSVVAVQKRAPQIVFHWDASYNNVTNLESIGNYLYLEVSAAGSNLDPKIAESITITITSKLTGDTESVTAVETGPNSGIFRINQPIITADVANSPATAGNGIVETAANDQLTASFTDQFGQTVTAFVTIDPFFVVFDSRTNLPVAGAVVTLVDITGVSNGGAAGAPARVFAVDGVTSAPNPVTTGGDGVFRFAHVVPGTYRIVVAPPGYYVHPSVIAAADLPAGRRIDVAGSYGGVLTLLSGSSTLMLDIPVDYKAGSGFFIEKTASKHSVEVGEFIDYTLRIRNATGTILSDITVNDALPSGVAYQANTTTIDKLKVDDSVQEVKSNLVFKLSELKIDGTAIISYRVAVKAGTRESLLKNSAQAVAGSSYGLITSNTAVSEVKLRAGVFTEQGVVIGRVYIDDNSNGIIDSNEMGMPGVRIYLDDGSFVITDGQGKYSLYGVAPGTHVLRMDTETLPDDAAPTNAGFTAAGDGKSSFVEVRQGEMRKVNFALDGRSQKVKDEAVLRRKALEKSNNETITALGTTLPVKSEPVDISENRALSASGYVTGNNQTIINNLPMPGSSSSSGNSSLPSAPVRPAQTSPLADRIPSFTNELGFVDLAMGDILPMSIWNVIVKGRIGSTFILKVNGKEISDSQVGAKHTYFIKNIEVWEFIGIEFKPGNNSIMVTQRDSMGNDRGEAKINVVTSGLLSKISVVPQAEKQVADGMTPVPVTVRMTDSDGMLVQTRIPLTLESDGAEWNVQDLNPQEPGVQVFLDGGEAKYELLPPHEASVTTLRVSSGLLSGSARMEFLPNLRPLMAVGVVDLGVAQNQSTTLSHSQASLFMKGRVTDDTLLTLSYQSNKSAHGRLFRDIQPDEFYPVYGDSSIKGYDAQTSQETYLRLENRQSFLMYGDFSTSSSDSSRNLSNYNRSLTGVMSHYEQGANAVNFFTSYDSTRQNIFEVLANGTSGPYSLGSGEIVENSERVEILVRDRNQPSVILKTTPMTRLFDYTIDRDRQTVLFKTPVPSFDANLNPVSIRVTCEVDAGGPKYWTAGVDGRISLRKNLSLTASYVSADVPDNAWTMTGVSAEWQLTPNSKLTGELAQTSSDLLGKGLGQRIEYTQESDKIQARIMAANTDLAFDNTASAISKGRTEISSKITYLQNQHTRYVAEAIQSEDRSMGSNRTGMYASVEKSITPELRLELGVRHAEETRTQLPTSETTDPAINFTSFRAKVTALVPQVPSATIYTEYEQDISDSERNVLALGGEYLFANRGRLYARHELNSTLTGRYLLNANQTQQTSVIGIDTDYLGSAHVFSEYRARDAFSGRETEAAIGLRNQWELRQGVRVNASLERIEPVDGKTKTASTAITGALEYTRNVNWKGTARVEYRTNAGNSSWMTSIGSAVKLSNDWTMLGKGIVQVSNSDLNTQTQARMLMGLAYRGAESDKWNGLAKYELRYDNGGVAPDNGRELSHIVSTDINYQPSASFESGTHLALRLTDNTLGPISSSSKAMLMQERLSYNASKRLQLSLISGIYWNDLFDDSIGSIGLEAGLLMHRNVWLSAGYNFTGFDDEHLSNGNYTGKGPYMRLRFKFDEALLGAGREASAGAQPTPSSAKAP